MGTSFKDETLSLGHDRQTSWLITANLFARIPLNRSDETKNRTKKAKGYSLYCEAYAIFTQLDIDIFCNYINLQKVILIKDIVLKLTFNVSNTQSLKAFVDH